MGIPAVFVRFSGCNLRCPWCDTEFSESTPMSAEEIVAEVQDLYDIPNERRKMVVLTGGEPGLQVDKPLVDALHAAGFYICIETNGTRPLPDGIDWITCSPKQDTTLALKKVNEVLDVNPSAENIARWICDHVENCYKVSVQESEGNVAIYERD